VPHLQAAAEKAVRANGKAGAVVAFVPDTGAVLALFSVPGERGDPLLVAHQPASTFKTFTALAGLEAGALTPSTEKQCTGKYKFADKEFRCAGVHGRETTTDAIVRSCNGFFYDVATEIDHSRIIDMARRFGFGSRTGIELSDDAGHVADAARVRHIKLDRRSPVPLRDAIGHGEIKVTLLQLARAYAAIANGGKLVRLRLTQSQPATNAPLGAIERVKMQPEHLELIRAALIDVVASQDGTVHSFAIEGFPFAAKTGAAEAPLLNGRGEEDDAWCVAYAPPRAPKILVAARVERADVSRDAKLAVKQVLEAWRASTP
jgi:penicillin-binding protein 2